MPLKTELSYKRFLNVEKPNCLMILIPVVEGMITVTVSSPLLYFQLSPFEDMENSRCSFKWGWEDQISSASLHGPEQLRIKTPVLKGEACVRPSHLSVVSRPLSTLSSPLYLGREVSWETPDRTFGIVQLLAQELCSFFLSSFCCSVSRKGCSM